jgi:hypothetical protein
MKEIFELQGKLILDPKKKTIVFVDKGDQSEYTNTYGAARYIKDKLKDTYNVITIGTSCGLEDNYYAFNGAFSDGLWRKKDNPNAHEDNSRLVHESFQRAFKDLKSVDNIILGTDFGFRLPSRPYFPKSINEDLHELKHEYFDYVGDDQVIIDQINEYNQKFGEDIFMEISPLAFSTKVSAYFNYLILFMHKEKILKKNVIAFIIDPAFSSFIFSSNNIPLKLCYFEDDKRGTRDFMKFPISQFQHLLYDPKFIDDWDEPSKKTHNMFFGGTIFHDTGFRSTVWPTFLKDIKSPKCSYFIPMVRNNFTKSNKRHTDYLEENQSELLEQVTNHKNYKPGVTSLDLYKQMEKFKYGIVFRCVSTFDSLNFKPVLYVSKDILPFLDEKYDPSFLQIPEHIQKELLVRNSKDIDDRIKYFNDNDQHRLEILAELRKLFKIDEFLKNENDIISTEINKLLG